MLKFYCLLLSFLAVSFLQASILGAECPRELSDLVAADLANRDFLVSHYGITGLGAVVKPATEAEIRLVESYWLSKAWNLGVEIPALEVKEMAEALGLENDRLVQALASYVSGYSRPAISEYPVGIVALTDSRSLLFGVNFELPAEALGQTIHGEQFVITRAHALGRRIEKMILNAPPCGHCRQFVNETEGASELRLSFPDAVSHLPFPLVLPLAFGPKNLGIEKGALLGQVDQNFSYVGLLNEEPKITEAALLAANRSYSPYTGAYAGLALLLDSGEIFSGSHLENVGFNPSIAPFSAALVNLFAAKAEWSSSPADKRGTFHQVFQRISRVILAEKPKVPFSSVGEKSRPHFLSSTRQLMTALSPQAEIRSYSIHEPKKD